MGSGASKHNSDSGRIKMLAIMPAYCVNESLKDHDVIRLQQSWNIITNNLSQEYNEMMSSGHEVLLYQSCVDWFGDVLFQQFITLNPDCRHLFKLDLSEQGKMLGSFINMLIDGTSDKESAAKLDRVAESHYRRGISANEYRPFGQALLYALEKCIGPEHFDEQTRRAWVIAYSNVIKVMIEKIIEHEDDLLKPSDASAVSCTIPHIDSVRVAHCAEQTGGRRYSSSSANRRNSSSST